MTDRTVSHGTFVVERDLKAAPSRVFAAFADPVEKAKWFGSLHSIEKVSGHFDVRDGGSEHLEGRWPSGMVSRFDARYYEVLQDERIVYAYDMHIDGALISVSVATIEFRPKGAGTHLVITETGAYLDGHAPEGARLREDGTNQLIDKLVESVGG